MRRWWYAFGTVLALLYAVLGFCLITLMAIVGAMDSR